MLKLLQVVTRLISSIISDMLSFGMNFVVLELTCQVETLKLTCENYTQKLDEKERELVKSVQAVHAEEWQKQHALENEKYIREHLLFLFCIQFRCFFGVKCTSRFLQTILKLLQWFQRVILS